MHLLKNFNSRYNLMAFFALVAFIAISAISNKSEYFKRKIIQNNALNISVSGGCNPKYSPYLINKIEPTAQITYCSSGDSDTHTIVMDGFSGKRDFFLYTAGYFGENVKLVFEVEGKVVLPVNELNQSPGEMWTEQKITLPYDGIKKVKITLIDTGSSFKEWGGLSIPESNYTHYKIIDQLQILLWLIVFFIVSLSVTNLCCLYLMKYTKEDSLISLLLFIFLCTLYYFSFWLYYLFHDIGLLFSYLTISVSVFILFKSIFNGIFFHLYRSSNTLKLYLLPIIYVLILFSFSMSYGELHSIQKTAATAFTHELPFDNFLPKVFADQVYHEKLTNPMIGDWLSSDRPPLQTGQFLFFYKLFSGSDIGYQLTSSLLQAYFIIPLILLLNLFIKENRFIRFLIFTSIAFSSVILVNSNFVWPKLIAGTALLFTIYILINIKIFKSKTFAISLSATLASISLLSHTGSIFSLIPIALVSLFVFKPNTKSVLIAISIAITMVGPWIFYQKFIDPPGDRLAKWHLAGKISINNTPLVDAIKSAYSDTSSEDIVSAKVSNFHKLFEGVLNTDYAIVFLKMFDGKKLDLSQIDHVKAKLFFNFFYSMGLIFFFGLISFIILVVTDRDKILNRFLFFLFFPSIISLIVWCLLMFEPGSTIIHQGSYFPWIALVILFSIVIFFAFKRISILFFGTHLLSSFFVYFMSVIITQSISNILIFPVFLMSITIFLLLSFKFFGSIDIQQRQ